MGWASEAFIGIAPAVVRALTFTGSTLLEPHIFGDLVSYIERGEIRPMLAATYPLRQLHEAQQVFIDKKHSGNIVVTMDDRE